MVEPGNSMSKILGVMADGKPKSHRDVVRLAKICAASNALRRCWERELLLRTEKPRYEFGKVFKGRTGLRNNLRPFHLYILKPKKKKELFLDGQRYVTYSPKYLDVRGKKKKGGSKAQRVLSFLKVNHNKAWFSIDIVEALKDQGIKISDVMANIRRFEKKGLVYVRGYRTDESQTPFKEGYLITYINSNKLREKALEEAIQRTTIALDGKESTNPIVHRVHLIRDLVFEATKLRDLASFTDIMDRLGCTEHEAHTALTRALQLYPELKEIKLFDAYRYYHHSSVREEDLQAAISLKENFIRKSKGRDNRIGHNWEAVAEWFVDKFTTGARFWSQEHRNKRKDRKRITVHLIKSVRGRRNNAEVDRVWEITPSIFAQTITYVLSCKWSLINKDHLDDFLQVLMWSKEFGVDTSEGRQVKQGTIGIFAGSSFNPKEKIKLKNGEKISLTSYANRMNLQILKASDFNDKLRNKGCTKETTVQKICRIAKNEREVRETIDQIWDTPTNGETILSKLIKKNEDLYQFEKMLKR